MSEEAREGGLGAVERAERLIVLAVSLHSAGVGLFLLALPASAVRFSGFGGALPLFFARQAGVFHLVLAAGYAAEHLRTRGITLLLVAKTAAAVFLLASTLGGGVPWSVPVSAALDGLIALSVFLVHAWASASRGAPRQPNVLPGQPERARPN